MRWSGRLPPSRPCSESTTPTRGSAQTLTHENHVWLLQSPARSKGKQYSTHTHTFVSHVRLVATEIKFSPFKAVCKDSFNFFLTLWPSCVVIFKPNTALALDFFKPSPAVIRPGLFQNCIKNRRYQNSYDLT